MTHGSQNSKKKTNEKESETIDTKKQISEILGTLHRLQNQFAALEEDLVNRVATLEAKVDEKETIIKNLEDY